MSPESCLIDSYECVGTENAQTFDLTPSETGDRSTFVSKKIEKSMIFRKKCTQIVHRAEKMYKIIKIMKKHMTKIITVSKNVFRVL